MCKMCSIKVSWIFILVMIVPGAMIMAEDPPTTGDQATREARPAAATGGDVAQRPEFRLFERMPVPPPSAEGQTKAGAAYGIVSTAATAGGKFTCVGASGEAYLGYGDYGIWAEGNYVGGYFKDRDGSGRAYLGLGDDGISASGDRIGGGFSDRDDSGYAYVGYGDYGIWSYGNTAGGRFEDLDNSGYALVGYGDYGVAAYGNNGGGYFRVADSTAYARAGYDRASGNDNGGHENAGEYGVYASGSKAGGYFEDSASSGLAYVGYDDSGILAYGNNAGGHFFDANNKAYSNVCADTYKIIGNGTVSNVQNHPYDRDSVIVYAAPEGDEVATYTWGAARLDGGEARVPLGETFKWVTNPDIGLTAHLTARGEPIPLAVVELSSEEMIVRAPNDAPEGLIFDYLVYGLRIGFEESSVVQEKEQESNIPSMANHRQLYERRPDLKSYNSLERFKGMRREVGQKEELDLSRAHALRDAIIEFDPAVHELPGIPERPEAEGRVSVAVRDDIDDMGVEQGLGESDQNVRATAPGARIGTTAIPMDAEGNVYATSFRPSSQDLASLLEVSEAVEPGDVLVIDRSGTGMMRRASEASDTGVIGVVAASPGVVLGMKSPSRMPVERHVDRPDGEPMDRELAADDLALRAPVAFSGVVLCKVDAAYGSVWPGDLLVTSATPGHAMRQELPLPGTVLGKALEALEEGAGTIRVLVMLR